MTRGKRVLLGSSAALLLVAWSVAQLVLTHRETSAAYRDEMAWYHRAVATFGAEHVRLPQPAPTRGWLLPAMSGIVAVLALTLVAALLVRGGRRWWAAVVVASPAANAYYGWEDMRFLGRGWEQISDHMVGWQVTGVIVDTMLLATVVALLVATVPARPVDDEPRATAWRSVPVMLVLAGWWFDRNPLPDHGQEIWLLQALAYVFAVSLLATSRLPVAWRAAGIFVVLPFCSAATTWAALNRYDVVAQLVHHDLFALATATYVLGVPALARSVRTRQARSVAVPSGG